MIKEKQSVMAGLEPNPARKYPAPIKKTELARVSTSTPTVHMAQAICMAILLPKLSAIKGMIKNPINEPTKTIDCSIVDVLSHRRKGSNSNTILLAWSFISNYQTYEGLSHIRFMHFYWLSYEASSQVMLLSKKKAIPSKSQAVRNHVAAITKNDNNWYRPYPSTRSINFYKGDKLLVSSISVVATSLDAEIND